MANLLMVKLLLNSVLSTLNANFVKMDMKNFYLNMPLLWYKYIQLKMDNLPEHIKKQYNLIEKATADGYAYVEIVKGVYGLLQADTRISKGMLSTTQIFQEQTTPGFWKHKTKRIQFYLLLMISR